MPDTKKYDYESRIERLIHKQNKCTVHFEYDQAMSGNLPTPDKELKVVTYNPEHKQHFLLGTFTGEDEADAARKAWEHVSKNEDGKKYNFTIKWYKKDDGKEHQSYFWARSIERALFKFDHEKNRDDFVILSVDLNPES